MAIPRDEFHGVGGSYSLDPKTGRRIQVEKPTEPSPNGEGGARDAEGKLLDKPSTVVEPAFAAPAAEAALETAPAPAPRKSRWPASADDAPDTSKGA